MEPLPKISVVTASFNSVHTIRDTIESVRRQDYPHWEHLVMDGGSTDGTLGILKEYPHLIWLSEKDEGHYHAMNKGIQRSSGGIVNMLNADDCYRSGALRTVAEAFQSHPEWDALFGDIVYVDAQRREIYRREEAVYDYDILIHSGVGYVIHQTLFYRKSLHDRLGMYQHKRFKNACDFDFILKLGRAKCRVGHVPALLIDYRYHDHGQSADLRVTHNMFVECLGIRKEHGFPDGRWGGFLATYYRLKRQWQKLRCRGKCDLISGRWILKRHMRKRTQFSSNIGLDKLEE